jgi:hypothetical protein
MVGRSLRAADLRYGGGKFQPAPKLTDYSTSQLNTLLKKLKNPPFKAPPRFDSQFGGDDPANTSGMTVLAILAHELGHVRGYDWAEPVPGFPGSDHAKYYDFSLLMNCVPGGFFKGSWTQVADSQNVAFAAPPWLPFGQPVSASLAEHAEGSGPPISVFVGSGKQPRGGSHAKADMYQPPRGGDKTLVALAANLGDLYSHDRPWASLLGSLSPTEDLVESYTLSALTQASPPLRSLRLNISSPDPDRQVLPEDVVGDLPNKPGLAGKLACVASLSQNYP